MKGMLQNMKRRMSSVGSSAPSDSSGGGGQHLGTHHESAPRRERRRSSLLRSKKVQELSDLPLLRDAPSDAKIEVFRKKLQLCSIVFNFDLEESNTQEKEMKRHTLLELVDFVNNSSRERIFTEEVFQPIMDMVSSNLCRSLPPQTEDFDPEEDEPVLEPSWPHLQVVYEFFLRFIVSNEVNAKQCKKYVNQAFIVRLIELFDSEDPRERDYLKTVLHRIYGKFMSHRAFIRRSIGHTFFTFIYETERHNGIGELLEILGSIINGFAMPLKKEHTLFLCRGLIPLHKPKCLGLYHQQLSYCVTQFAEKDPNQGIPILQGLIKFWPWSSSSKQVLFLNELEEILELVEEEQLEAVGVSLYKTIADCLGSDHFQVAERTLFLWNNETITQSSAFLGKKFAKVLLPHIYAPLKKNGEHWNQTVEGLAQSVMNTYTEYDASLVEQCAADEKAGRKKKKHDDKARKKKWKEVLE